MTGSEPTVGSKESAPLWKRVLPLVGALVIVVIIFGWVLPQFIDYDAVFRAIGEISGGEWLLLVLVGLLRIIPEAWVYQAALPGLTVKQGASEFLVVSALNNVPPGGLDLIARYQMSRSYGMDQATATTATMGTWFFVSYPKLMLPVIALVLLEIRHIRNDAIDTLALVGAIVIVVATGLVVLIVRSRKLAIAIGRRLGQLASYAARRTGRDLDIDFEARALEVRDDTFQLVRRRWRVGFPAGLAAQISVFVVLLLSAYAVGLDGADWILIFAGFAVIAIVGTIPILNAPGIAEAIYIGVLSVAVGGGQADEVAAAVFVFRILTWILPIPLGGLAYSRWRSSEAAGVGSAMA